MDDSDLPEAAENFQHQLMTLEKLVKQLSRFAPIIRDLGENAAHDPEARASAEALRQAWDNGLYQKLNSMREEAKQTANLMSECAELFENLKAETHLKEQSTEPSPAEEVSAPTVGTPRPGKQKTHRRLV